MLKSYTWPQFSSAPAPECQSDEVRRVPVVVVGAGPVGLCMAIDLAQRGLPVMLLDEDNTVSVGSRGLCYAQRTLEVLDRLGCGQAVVDKGVSWNVGRTFHRDAEVFQFQLQAEPGHQRPGMVNLQQYYLEEFLVRRAAELPNLDLRWHHKVAQVQPMDDGVLLTVETPDGSFRLHADWLVAADGARSPIRRQLGADIEGRVFKDRFLIADVVMQAPFPAERWFWFDPPFHPGQSVLLHREADNVWRIDFQLGWDADPEEAKRPENVIPRIQAMLGEAHPFELEWVSVYTFQCRRMANLRHGRVLFVGDAAHQVSPFGARGANSGIQDVDNLGWKLQAVVAGHAPEGLLDSYHVERGQAADENLQNSTRSTDFITPKSPVSGLFRDAVLGLAAQHPFARSLVNSGRLSQPTRYAPGALQTPDADQFAGLLQPGAPLPDAPLLVNGQDAWLLAQVRDGFTLLVFGADPAGLPDLLEAGSGQPGMPLRVLRIKAPGGWVLGGELLDVAGLAASRCDARDGTAYLIRPDQHVAARWRTLDVAAVQAAVARALGLPLMTSTEPDTAAQP
ncbi:FAD-dependent oxidoreductase [Ideonella margarita]|uniref:FAD-dependent oxidoreductase n=1 Tax=Ideonella margarita TaxID=2984191 RepID=A0ABU9C5T5_9BURK